MPQTLHSFFQSEAIKNPSDGNNIAGFVDNGEFKYFESSSLVLPAVVNALLVSKHAPVYVNRREVLWIKHYPLIKARHMDGLQASEGDGARMVEPRLQTVKTWPKQITALGLAPPLPGGGLYAAAVEASKAAALTAGSRKKGLARALRYYMLATYALVDISAAEAYEGLKNYVGTLLVSDKGEILAAGINTSSFRHAETSMMLSYFRKHPTATKLPENSVVFSTLTPCKGCTGYLEVAKSSNCKIYFGQEDTGKDGKVGKKISTQLSSVTKTPLGRAKEALSGDVDADDVGGDGVVVTGAASSIHKVRVDFGLSSCMDDSSIALQIGKAKDSRKVLTSASEALVHKMLKARKADDEESRVKEAVLHHIGQWLGTSKSGD